MKVNLKFYFLFLTVYFVNEVLTKVSEPNNKLNKKLVKKVVETTAKENINEPDLELLDQIESEVTYLGSECAETSIITKMDVFRSHFDGGKHDVTALEDRALADQYSKVLKATISNDDVNRNLKKNGLDDKQIEELAKAWRFQSKEEFFEEVKKMYRANGALGFQIESELIANENELKSYYQEHGTEFQEQAKYFFQTAFIPFAEHKDKDKLKKEIENYKKIKVKPDFVHWGPIIELDEAQITSANDFLLDLPVDEIYVKEFDDGINLYKLKSKILKKVVPFEDVKENIVMQLKKNKYPVAMQKIKSKLRSNAIIIRPTEKFKIPKKSKELV